MRKRIWWSPVGLSTEPTESTEYTGSAVHAKTENTHTVAAEALPMGTSVHLSGSAGKLVCENFDV